MKLADLPLFRWRRWRAVPRTVAFACLVLAFAVNVCGAERVALVIGNGRYDNLSEGHQLTSPVADATDVAAQLKVMGYTIVTGGALTNATRDQMIAAKRDFVSKAAGAEAAVFYYSGHGVQIGDENFLLARDTPAITSYATLKDYNVNLRESVMSALEEAGTPTKVIVLDCCRDNPFATQLDRALSQLGKSVRTKGLGEISGYGSGFYLAFATSPGTQALDGNGARNSPFTAAFLKKLPTGGSSDIDVLFRGVNKLLGKEQIAWTNHSLTVDFFSLASLTRPPVVPIPSTPPGSASPSRIPATVGDAFEGTKAGDRKVIAGIAFRWCPAGSFMMGSPENEKERGKDETQHLVNLARGFWLAETELTQAQWESVMGTSIAEMAKKGSFGKNLADVGSEYPMYYVSWDDAQEWCGKKAQGGGLPAGWRLSLPTEAQWEYACRAGTTTVFSFGNSLSSQQANFDGNSPYGTAAKGTYLRKTVKVGSYAPNEWGLYDMHGNVWEWCLDWYGGYPSGSLTDPVGPNSGVNRVIRGGSWGNVAAFCRAAHRDWIEPGIHFNDLGFRPALVPSR